jgi:imidazole glycerol-phosphate synthase subunit HisH
MGLVVVVDYGMGNLGSVANALNQVRGANDILVSSHAADVQRAERVVFPGQGAMPDCMAYLHQSGLLESVLEASRTKPLFGVCVGEQMLFDYSDEAVQATTAVIKTATGKPIHSNRPVTPGLGLMPGKVGRFSGFDKDGNKLKVPHMGWNRVFHTRPHALLSDIPDGSFFYFVHSFFVQPELQEHSIGECDYGERFTCTVARDNIFATQFHPEKSAGFGLQLYKNFLAWKP